MVCPKNIWLRHYKIEESSEIINLCWNGRNVHTKNRLALFWNLKYHSNNSYVDFQIVQLSDSFHKTFFNNSFVFLFIFYGTGSWLLSKKLLSSTCFWLKKRKVSGCKRGSTMVKGLLLVSHTGFPQCLHNQYVSTTQVTQNCKFSILNLATAYFTGTFWETWYGN